MSYRRQRGFTLLELLIVVAIIIVLIVSLVVSVSFVNDKAHKAATAGLIGTLSQAIAGYNQAEGCFPGGKVYAEPKDDCGLLFDAIYYGTDIYKPEKASAKGIGCSQGPLAASINKRFLRSAADPEAKVPEDALADPTSDIVIVDDWGQPMHYIEYASKDQAKRTAVKIGDYTHKPKNKDSYDLFSSGPDRKLGTKDDVGNW